MTDQEFREQYQPLHVPAHFDKTAPLADQILFALAQLNTGNASQIINEMQALGGETDQLSGEIEAQLTNWYDKGLLAGEMHDEVLTYSLQKITHANDGEVDPDLLAPGLD